LKGIKCPVVTRPKAVLFSSMMAQQYTSRPSLFTRSFPPVLSHRDHSIEHVPTRSLAHSLHVAEARCGNVSAPHPRNPTPTHVFFPIQRDHSIYVAVFGEASTRAVSRPPSSFTMNSAADGTEALTAAATPLSAQDIAEVIQGIREASSGSPEPPVPVAAPVSVGSESDDADQDDAGSYYWDASTMAPLNATSAVST